MAKSRPMPLYRALGYRRVERAARHLAWAEVYRAHRRGLLVLTVLFGLGFAALVYALVEAVR